MDFFYAQDHARRMTWRLVWLLAIALVAVVAATNLLVLLLMYLVSAPETLGGEHSLLSYALSADPSLVIMLSTAVVAVVVIGSVYKLVKLSGGGRSVAELLGGERVRMDSGDALEQRLIHVVEEMALAAGVPVPGLYVLRAERGMNAFAAGYTASDAVIGVTQGLLEQLNREQLQGVIAHEFSHILNGDMRLNIRMIGLLHGIMVIGMVGEFLLRSFRVSGEGERGRGGGQFGVLVFGLGLMAIGYLGAFAGNVIKAAVSRQREFLADASAVQYTRNPDGVAGALKVIGGSTLAGRLNSPAAAQLSHGYFVTGISQFFDRLLATHPALDERIRRIEPSWDGRYLPPRAVSAVTAPAQADAADQPVLPLALETLLAAVGQVDEASLGYSRALLARLPSRLLEALHDCEGACAVVYLLLLDAEHVARESQLALLGQYETAALVQRTSELALLWLPVEPELRLPLLDLALPSLHQLTPEQYQRIKQAMRQLIAADRRINLFEWSLQQLLTHHLDRVLKPAGVRGHVAGRYTLAALETELRQVLSFLTHAGHDDELARQRAFASGWVILGREPVELLPREQVTLVAVGVALERLAALRPLQKPLLLKALVAVAATDGVVRAVEAELIRAIAAVLDAPMPPLRGGGIQAA